MKVPFVDLKAQYQNISEEINSAISSVIERTAFIKGPFVEAFEKEFADFIGIKNCVGVANGTDAIEIALQALGVSKGDEVLVPSHTWISTSESVSSLGAKPVFVEVSADDYCIDPSLIEDKITKATKGIIAVHLYGHPAPMPKILEISKKHSLFVIEDCAQAHAATINNQQIGTFGDMATFSFFPGKNLGAYGDAGGIVCNDDKLADTARMIANHGRLGKFDHEFEGRNSRLDGLQAAILSVKLKYLSEWTDARIKAASKYSELLSGSDLILPVTKENCKHVFHLYVVQSSDRDNLRKELAEKGISSGIHYPVALPFLKAYENFKHKEEDFKVSYDATQKIISLPIYPEITDEQIEYVCFSLKEIISQTELPKLPKRETSNSTSLAPRIS